MIEANINPVHFNVLEIYNCYKLHSSHYTSFPDTGRAEGHLYDRVFYSTPEHYSDSSVLIITPEHLNAGNSVDLIFWFHGWNNNIDTAITKYGLARQFEHWAFIYGSRTIWKMVNLK